MPSRAEQKEKRRWDILEAGLDQFIRRGYAATKIQDIANKAGMSVGLLFHYFPSKEDLYVELLQIGSSTPQRMFDAIGDVKPLEFFEMCAGRIFEYAASSEFTSKMFVLMNHVAYFEGVPERAKEFAIGSDFYTGLVPLIERGQADGSIRAGDPVALCIAFWTAIRGSVETHAIDPALPLPEPEWVVDIIRG
jgi:AcrR family transcriptional regulator